MTIIAIKVDVDYFLWTNNDSVSGAVQLIGKNEKTASVSFFLLLPLGLLFPEGRLWRMQRDEVAEERGLILTACMSFW